MVNYWLWFLNQLLKWSVISCYHESHLANCMSTNPMGGGCQISNIPPMDSFFMDSFFMALSVCNVWCVFVAKMSAVTPGSPCHNKCPCRGGCGTWGYYAKGGQGLRGQLQLPQRVQQIPRRWSPRTCGTYQIHNLILLEIKIRTFLVMHWVCFIRC
jgi:hypothetical protein